MGNTTAVAETSSQASKKGRDAFQTHTSTADSQLDLVNKLWQVEKGRVSEDAEVCTAVVLGSWVVIGAAVVVLPTQMQSRHPERK